MEKYTISGLHHPDTHQPLTVTQLSSYLKQYIEKGFSDICLQGEISGCTRHSSGHTYFSIKDEKATLDAICWRGTRLPSSLANGTLVICRGKITTYGARSKYQIIVNHIQLAGQGAMLERIEALRQKLIAEGLFDPEHKKDLPQFPQTIALITSPTGAVIQDMLNRFRERIPCHLIMYPVNVQGPRTVPDIVQALHMCQSHAPKIDLIIVARGGGSTEDLWPFHDEQLVRAVASSTIPIISAIGHETDTTLIDYAADHRAPTPTAAAETALPLVRTVQERIVQQVHTLHKNALYRYDMMQSRMDVIQSTLHGWRTFFWPLEQKIDELYDRLTYLLKERWLRSRHRLDLTAQSLKQTPLKDVMQHNQRLDHICARLTQHVHSFVRECTNRADHVARLLEPLSYQKTLDRGFTLVTDEQGTTCTHKAQAAHHSRLKMHFVDGTLLVRPI